MNRQYCRKPVSELGRRSLYYLRQQAKLQVENAKLSSNNGIARTSGTGKEHERLDIRDDQIECPKILSENDIHHDEPPDSPMEFVMQYQELGNGMNNNIPNNGDAEILNERNLNNNINADDAVQEENQDEHLDDVMDEEDQDSDEDDEPDLNRRANRPLYAGANITLGDSLLLVLSLMLRHNLPLTCLEDILTVIQFHCPNNALQKVSLYKFKKHFSFSNNDPFKKHFYCCCCLVSLADENAVCHICNERKPVAYFLEMTFLRQLQRMLKRPNFYESLQYRFNRDGVQPNHIQDIYDGSLYRRFVQEGFLSNPNNISFMWYADGVPVFKSSKISMWPIYLSINELPYSLRIKRENMLLAGLWFGKKKPEPNLFISKLRPNFEMLYRGKNFQLPEGNNVRIRGILLAGTCDVPAKTEFLNLTLYSGAYGCCNCTLKGHTFHHPSGGTSHVFPYQRNIQERTSDETIAQGREALRNANAEAVMGVKGLSALSYLMPDYIGGTGIDVMHKVYGGVVKKMLYIWFDSSYSGQPFSLRHLTEIIDRRLISLKPPKSVHRMPRSILELCHWKASELEMWFYYYGVVILHGIMLPVYFNHFLLLIVAISLLNSTNISQVDVQKARKLIHKFVREFPNLYGERQSTINVHGLLHLPECVLRLGPLWAYQCNPYEDLNGKLLKLVHGTTHLDSQISHRHCQLIKFYGLLETLPEGEMRDFVFYSSQKHLALNERLFAGCYSVGPYNNLRVVPQRISMALQNSNVQEGGTIKTYLRLLKGRKVFVSESYPRAMKTCSSYVTFLWHGVEKVGSIHVFLKISRCDCLLNNCLCQKDHFAVVSEMRTDRCFEACDDEGRRHPLWHIHRCERTDRVLAISLRDISSICVFLRPEGNEQYVGIPINEHEKEHI